MKLQHITFTGIDGKADLGALWELQQQYPDAQFGREIIRMSGFEW